MLMTKIKRLKPKCLTPNWAEIIWARSLRCTSFSGSDSYQTAKTVWIEDKVESQKIGLVFHHVARMFQVISSVSVYSVMLWHILQESIGGVAHANAKCVVSGGKSLATYSNFHLMVLCLMVHFSLWFKISFERIELWQSKLFWLMVQLSIFPLIVQFFVGMDWN